MTPRQTAETLIRWEDMSPIEARECRRFDAWQLTDRDPPTAFFVTGWDGERTAILAVRYTADGAERVAEDFRLRGFHHAELSGGRIGPRGALVAGLYAAVTQ